MRRRLRSSHIHLIDRDYRPDLRAKLAGTRRCGIKAVARASPHTPTLPRSCLDGAEQSGTLGVQRGAGCLRPHCFRFPFAIGSSGNGNRKRPVVYDLASSIVSIAASSNTLSTHSPLLPAER